MIKDKFMLFNYDAQILLTKMDKKKCIPNKLSYSVNVRKINNFEAHMSGIKNLQNKKIAGLLTPCGQNLLAR